MNVVIMAGGGGTRLWPLSRKNRPKQFIDLGSGHTLLEHTYHRARQLVAPENIYVAALADYAADIKRLLPQVPEDNIFFEPTRRDTTAAFAAIALRLKVKGAADQPTSFFWSDHIFTDEAAFVRDLKLIPALVEKNPDSIIMVGHTPVSPETGFGYIETGKALSGLTHVFHVKSFREKPDRATSESFLQSKNYFWNMGCFSFKPQYLLDELLRTQPDLESALQQLETAIASNNETKAREIYTNLPKLAIEYTVIEKTPRVIAITGDYGWSDVGNWKAVREIFGTKGDYQPHAHHVHVDSQNNYVYNDTSKVVSLVGMKDTIVVVTADAILVTNTSHAHQVKDVVTELEQSGKTDHI